MRTEADEFQAHIEQGDLLSSHPTKGPELEAAFEKQEEVQHDDSEMQLKRKRRRDEWERNKTERRLWELHRNLGNLVRRADDLISEVCVLINSFIHINMFILIVYVLLYSPKRYKAKFRYLCHHMTCFQRQKKNDLLWPIRSV